MVYFYTASGFRRRVNQSLLRRYITSVNRGKVVSVQLRCAAAGNADPGRGRTFSNVGPAWETKTKLFVVAIGHGGCQVLAVGRHCKHCGLRLLQRNLVVLVLDPLGAHTINVFRLTLPSGREQHTHGFPSNALHLAREHSVLSCDRPVRFRECWVKTTNAGKAIGCGVRGSKVLADLAAVAAERLPEQRRNGVGVHGHVAVCVLRVHNVIVEATNLVLVAKLVANNFHLGFGRRGKDTNSLANAAVGSPCKFNLLGNALVVGAGAWIAKASVRANNWIACWVLGLGPHADKPSLLLGAKVLELLTF